MRRNNIYFMSYRKKNYAAQYAKKSAIIAKHIDKIKSSANTREINYPEYKESFDYVDNKFPGNRVKDATIFLCSKGLLKGLGYVGLGGFFEKILKTIIICNEGAIDETIVHEMLHYVSDLSLATSYSVELEEEFAYINSIDYLRNKGRTDEYIISTVFLPYLMGKVDKNKIIKEILTTEDLRIFSNKDLTVQKRILKRYKKKIESSMIEHATNLGKDIIELHNRKSISGIAANISDDNIFDLMEF